MVVLLAFVVSATGLVVLALTLRESEALDTIPVYQGTVIVIGAISGAFVLDEQKTNDARGISLYVLSLLLIVAALAMLAVRERSDGGCAVPDTPLKIPWFERIAKQTRGRIDRHIGAPEDELPSVTGSKEAALLGARRAAPTEASGLLPT